MHFIFFSFFKGKSVSREVIIHKVQRLNKTSSSILFPEFFISSN